MTTELYVLGHPVAHSLSPAMHNAAYAALGLDWHYGRKDCATADEARVFLESGSWLALNVTMPYKPLAFEFAGKRSSAARLACGANVLVWDSEGTLHADNTDGKGCIAYLERSGVSFKGAEVVVCGTGPTSLAIMHAVAQSGAGQITLLGRSEDRSRQAVSAYRSALEGIEASDESQSSEDSRMTLPTQGRSDSAPAFFQAGAYDTGVKSLRSADVIIDATPLGMNEGDLAPFDTSLLSKGQVVFDVVYGHGETRLLAGARRAGCSAFDGSGMLVAQAVETVCDIASITNRFEIPRSIDLFDVMAKAAHFSF